MWVRQDAASASVRTLLDVGLVQNGRGGLHLYIQNSRASLNDGFTPSIESAVNSVVAGQWNHIAISRISGTNYLFVNGAVAGTSTQTFPNQANYVSIGAAPAYAFFFNGYIDEVRISKGVARYYSAFTPPTTAFAIDTSVGSLIMAEGGGGINTCGKGSMQLGFSGQRTTLAGTATADRSILFPDASGTLALASAHPFVISAASSSGIAGTTGQTVAPFISYFNGPFGSGYSSSETKRQRTMHQACVIKKACITLSSGNASVVSDGVVSFYNNTTTTEYVLYSGVSADTTSNFVVHDSTNLNIPVWANDKFTFKISWPTINPANVRVMVDLYCYPV
jgi:hypothetical protein